MTAAPKSSTSTATDVVMLEHPTNRLVAGAPTTSNSAADLYVSNFDQQSVPRAETGLPLVGRTRSESLSEVQVRSVHMFAPNLLPGDVEPRERSLSCASVYVGVGQDPHHDSWPFLQRKARERVRANVDIGPDENHNAIMGVLPTPHGQQREVVYLREKGHCVVLGAAGSGKTVMAVHRARHLAKAPGFGGPTLLVTFNQALVPYLRELADRSEVTIETYHALASRYVSLRTGWSRFVCDQQLKENLVARALDDVRAADGHDRSFLRRPVDFFLDELHWLAVHGITTPDTYISGKLKRIGRGNKLETQDRAIAYRVYQRYLALREQANRRCDWDDLASVFLRLLQNDNDPRRYRHVVVDEGQDFTPEMIRSLAAAIPEEGSLTFFADYAQQIYGSRMSWRSLGLNIRKPWSSRRITGITGRSRSSLGRSWTCRTFGMRSSLSNRRTRSMTVWNQLSSKPRPSTSRRRLRSSTRPICRPMGAKTRVITGRW